MQRRTLLRITRDALALAAVSPMPARAQSTGFTFYSSLAEEWYSGGSTFPWLSTTANNNRQVVNVFHRSFGTEGKPDLVLVHGYPTCSFDYRDLIDLLQDDYRIHVLDFPGFGFSDKPQPDYHYMIEDDARLLDHFVDQVLGLESFHLFTHDRGVSVGLAFLGHYLDRPANDYRITYHFMSNSGMFLPLATLSEQQTVLLDPVRGPEAIARLKAQPRLTEGDPVQVAYADIHAFNDGIGARLHVGKYLLERAANETRWLDNLHRSPIPTGYLWGLLDPVNPVRIANHVWATYLNDREVESSFWYLPTAGHYPQRDKPGAVAEVIRTCLNGQVPSRAEEDNYIRRSTAQRRSADDPLLVGHSTIRPMSFPGAVEYSPDGYR
ncbi:MAG: hypothetical protein RLZZ385_1236 [Pseudomonadota bacterium]|jgi:pimeloyl-ACP methyl ester carboxylesterase